MKSRLLLAACICTLINLSAQSGNQKEERLAVSVRAALHAAVSDAPPTIAIGDAAERERWLTEMSQRLEKRILRDPKAHEELLNPKARNDLLTTIHYEATRAGLDPQLVLSLIQIESRFIKTAVSKAGARGYMQVMPFWVDTIGNREDNLFHMRTNLRYGCTILRHYIDLEKGDLYHALGRYNGSRGKPEYPNRVYAAMQNQWAWTPSQTPVKMTAEPASPAPAKPSPAAVLPVAAAPAKLTQESPPPAAQPPVPASKPPATAPQPQQVAAATPPAPEPPRVGDPPAPAKTSSPSSRVPIPARRDIVIVH